MAGPILPVLTPELLDFVMLSSSTKVLVENPLTGLLVPCLLWVYQYGFVRADKQQAIKITTCDSRNREYDRLVDASIDGHADVLYHKYIKHLRIRPQAEMFKVGSGNAVHQRSVLVDALRSKQYFID